jgi:protein ImuB
MFAAIHNAGHPAPSAEALLECARAFSPSVETAGDATVVFSVEGLGTLCGGPDEIGRAVAGKAAQSGIKANVAVAANPDAALLVARHFAGVTVVPEGAAESLSRLRVGSLSPPIDLAETLGAWGVRTFAEFAALPNDEVAARLGQSAVRFQRLARGEGSRPLLVGRPAESYEERVELDDPVSLLEPLLFILSRALGALCGRLVSHGEAAGEVSLGFDLEGGERHARRIRLPFPVWRARTLLRLVRADLEARPPHAAVTAVGVSLRGVPPRRLQGGLYVPQSPEPEKLELTLARIRGLVGEENVGVAELLDTHRPDAFVLRPLELSTAGPATSTPVPTPAPGRLGFRYFRPPLPAKVGTKGGRPSRLRTEGPSGKVFIASGPWRSSGDWWTAEEWERDEWDVALADGAVYRLVLDAGAGWFVEGCYD